jgi:hypothetical protein
MLLAFLGNQGLDRSAEVNVITTAGCANESDEEVGSSHIL